MSDGDVSIRTISSLNCSTTALLLLVVVGGSGSTGLRGFHHDRSRGSRCRATDDRAGRTTNDGTNWSNAVRVFRRFALYLERRRR